jgi:hypothetical protein
MLAFWDTGNDTGGNQWKQKPEIWLFAAQISTPLRRWNNRSEGNFISLESSNLEITVPKKQSI